MAKDEWLDEHGFRDIVEKQQGIFDGTVTNIGGSSAMSDYARAKTKPTEHGMLIEMTCEGCGKGRQLVAEYPELIAIKYGLQPHVAYAPLIQRGIKVLGAPVAWGYDQEHQAWFPDLKCNCGWPQRPLIAVQEAASILNAALSRGWLAQSDEKQLSMHCHQMRQGRGG